MKSAKRNVGIGLLLMCAQSASWAMATPTDWEPLSDADGIKTYRKEIAGSPIVSFRGEGWVEAPMAKVASIIADTERKHEWMHKLVESKVVRPLTETSRIEYNHTSAPWPFQNRDFVFKAITKIDKNARRVTFLVESTPDDLMPPSGSKVRGALKNTIYQFTASEDGKRTYFEVEVNADPAGNIPKWIVNLFQKGWPRNTILGIRKQAAKEDVRESAYITNLLK